MMVAAITYLRPTLTALNAQALSDVTSANLPGSFGALLQKSNLRILALVIAGQTYELYAYLDYISQQCTPFTATDEWLEGWAALKSVYRIDATSATGPVSFTGVSGTVIPVGTVIADANTDTYVTQGNFIIGTTSNVMVTASVPGSAGNQDSGVGFTLVNPITGVSSTVLSTAEFTGGTDQETDDALRTRMLEIYGNPPQGGANADYIGWALAVPGCTRAWVQPQGYGPGSVIVYVMFDVSEAAYNGFPQGSNGGAAAETRITAASGDQLAVANAIYPVRPVTALVYVAAPNAQAINVTITGLVYLGNLTTIRSNVATAIAELFVQKGTALGGTIYPSDISAAISSVAGVTDFTLTSPSTTTATAVGSIPTLGSITWD